MNDLDQTGQNSRIQRGQSLFLLPAKDIDMEWLCIALMRKDSGKVTL